MILATLFVGASPAAAKTTIRFATLAPSGTPMVRVLRKLAKMVATRTNGRVEFKIYPGGRQGDEKDVVRKMRAGQLHASGMTAIGLAEIEKEILVLQMPSLFRKYSELDYVRRKMFGYFEKKFAARGFKLLNLGEIGFVYMFSTKPIRNISDLRKLRPWAWIDDPIALTFNRLARTQARLLALPAVFPALKAKMIDVVYATPLGVVALQWYTELHYVVSRPLAVGLGGTVMRLETWNSLSEADRKQFRDLQREWQGVLQRKGRRDNRKALKLLTENGIAVIQPSADAVREWEQMAFRVQAQLTGKLFPKSLLEQVKRHLKEYRASKGNTPK
ncbi:MAG: TRAP transporter substrate-binding protein DctP [Myxococcales bacterium]|nr:TRAP transporter substrate-binding protein DctP [Myxococcales bacterium]